MHKNSPFSRFLEQIRIGKILHLPRVAESVGLSWYKEIKPKIHADPEFQEAFLEVLEELKFELYDKAFQIALNGKSENVPNPELSYIKAVIELMDTILKEDKGKETQVESDDTLLSRLEQGSKSNETKGE